jgi:hypothetical protein
MAFRSASRSSVGVEATQIYCMCLPGSQFPHLCRQKSDLMGDTASPRGPKRVATAGGLIKHDTLG